MFHFKTALSYFCLWTESTNVISIRSWINLTHGIMLGVTTVVGFWFFARIKLWKKLIALIVEDSDCAYTSMRHDKEICKGFHSTEVLRNKVHCPKMHNNYVTPRN